MPDNYSISRRRFAQLLGVGAAAVAVRPSLQLTTAASDSVVSSRAPATVVRLSSNENPYGPSAMALKAMTEAFELAWRYPDEHAETLIDSLAKLNGVNSDQILLGDGSGEILKVCASAFTGPMTNEKPAGRGNLVAADPTFEAILAYAKVRGADVVKVPLNSSYGHDLTKMGAAAKEGLAYICNPNNPTASITPKNELRDFIARGHHERLMRKSTGPISEFSQR